MQLTPLWPETIDVGGGQREGGLESMQTGVTTRRRLPHAPAQIETGQQPGDGPRRGELPNPAPEGVGLPEPGKVEGGVTTSQIAGGAGDGLVRRRPRLGGSRISIALRSPA